MNTSNYNASLSIHLQLIANVLAGTALLVTIEQLTAICETTIDIASQI
jgi:hypothetical protein